MLAGLIAAATVATATLTSASDVRVAGRNVRLGDIATISGTAAPKLGELVIARLPQGSEKQVRRDELAILIRHAAPGVRVTGVTAGVLTIRTTAVEPPRPKLKPYVAEAPAIERGRKLTLTASVGPAAIARPVIALQDARRGDKRLFVRTDDGQVFSAPLEPRVAR